MKDDDNIIIYSMYLAGLLMTKGYVLLDMQPHRRQITKRVFFFRRSDKILEEIDEYKQSHSPES